MEHEVALTTDEQQYLVKIKPFQRVNGVIVCRNLRTCGVEESFHVFIFDGAKVRKFTDMAKFYVSNNHA